MKKEDVFQKLFEHHQLGVLFTLCVLLIIVGYGEVKILNRVTVACTTWFFALLIAAASISKIFGNSVVGIIVGILCFIFGLLILVNYWRRSSAKK